LRVELKGSTRERVFPSKENLKLDLHPIRLLQVSHALQLKLHLHQHSLQLLQEATRGHSIQRHEKGQQLPEKALSDVIKKEIAQALAKTENPSSIRMSSVGQGIPTTTDRMVMATQGESVEKATRKYLQGQLPREILDKTVVSVQMEGKSVGSGNVRLVLGEGQSLTAVQRAAFQEAFKKAVQSLKANYVPVN
jgi:hypothetical protein